MDSLSVLNVLNWNGRSLRNKTPELFEFMAKHQIDLAVITETWLQSNMSCSHSSFSCIRLDRDPTIATRGGGVMIVVRKGIKVERIDHLDVKVIEAVGIKVHTSRSPVRIIAAYYPGGSSRAKLSQFRKDVRKLASSAEPLFIVGDLNARHRAWNCLKANKAGNILYRTAMESGCTIHFPETHTFHPAGRGKPSTLDLTLSNNKISMSVPKVIHDLTSDHLPVIFSLNVDVPFSPVIHKYRNYSRADWPRFRRHLDRRLNLTDPVIAEIDNTTKIDEAVHFLTEAIGEAESASVPFTNYQPYQPTLPDSVKQLIRLRNIRRRQFYRRRDPFIGMIVSSLNHRIQEEVAEHRYKNFGSMVEHLEPGSSKFWKVSKLLRNKIKYNPPLKTGNTLVVSPAEKAKVLAENFAKSHLNNLPGDSSTNAEVEASILEVSQNSDINIEASTYAKPKEIRCIIQKLKSKKAPGEDGLRNIVLKNLTRKGTVFLTKIVNSCLRFSYFPAAWKSATVIAIAKPNKDITDPGNYRPISLLNTLSKILERVILNRLNRHLETSGTIPKEQFGFKPGHSTTHQLVRVSRTIRNAFAQKKSAGMVLLDIEKAYDSVWQEAIIFKLHRSRCPMYLVKILYSYLKNRTFRVSVNGSLSSQHQIPFGVPQGSVLSPVLYNVFTSDVVMIDGVIYTFFADDTGYLVVDSDPEIITTHLQAAENALENFQKKWRIKVNPSKTQAIFFTKKRATRNLPSREINAAGLLIPWSDEVKYLGLVLDRKLLFDKHVNYSIEKCRNLVRCLYSLINRRSKLKQQNKMLLYKAVFRPSLVYGAPAWLDCAASHRKRLQRQQNKILKMILNVDPLFPTDELHQLAEIDTLEEFMEKNLQKFVLSCTMSVNPLIQELSVTL